MFQACAKAWFRAKTQIRKNRKFAAIIEFTAN